MTEFSKGDVVRRNAEWRSYGRPQAWRRNRTGIVVGVIHDGLVSVQWDGRKTGSACLSDFLERVPANTDPLPPELAARFAKVEITPEDGTS